MKSRILAVIVAIFLALIPTQKVHAANEESGVIPGMLGALSDSITGHYIPAGVTPKDPYLRDCTQDVASLYWYFKRCSKDSSGNAYSPGMLGTQGKFVADLFKYQPSGKEYVADLLDSVGIPSVSRAYAQGVGYEKMQPFLPFWKAFRNLAYSLYIIMFVVIGIMIMLRTKINAQTVITIQAALPNLLITLILITFSYAIVGFMIDIMYFLIYFLVYLVASSGIISDPTKLVTRLMSYSAWSVIFEGRNSIISAVASSIGSVLWGLGTGTLSVAGAIISMISPMYLIVAVAFAIAMVKLMFYLIKSYVMLIVQTVTAPVQILMNAMPGSKAFGEWLKRTASYLIPFPVAAAMFIFSAILVGNPADKTIWGRVVSAVNPGGASAALQDDNPFGVNQGSEIYQSRNSIWLPPFTLTNSDIANADVLTLIGFFVFLMTPAAVKMAQDWLQVKESPYTAEAFSSIGMGVNWGTMPIKWGIGQQMHAMQEQKNAAIMKKTLSGAGWGKNEPKNEGFNG